MLHWDYLFLSVQSRQFCKLLTQKEFVGALPIVWDAGRITDSGPNWVIYMNGYDRLKPFGVATHGTICGYWSKMLWSHLCPSNKDLKKGLLFILSII